MTVKLVYHTPLDSIISGIRVCWNSQDSSDNGGKKDIELVSRIANKMKHKSVLRHSLYVFDIVASTKTLLGFTRHSVGVNFGVESTRYTAKKKGSKITLTKTGNKFIDESNELHLQNILIAIDRGYDNDSIAMMLPQAYNYRFQVSMNAEAIQHFLALRRSSSAHWDIRDVANSIYESIPEEHKFLFEDC